MKPRYTIIAKCYDKKGRLISVGTNNYNKSHPLQKHYAELVGRPDKIYLHAEILALLRAGETPVHRIDIEGYSKTGKVVNSKPCPICAAALRDFGVSIINHT